MKTVLFFVLINALASTDTIDPTLVGDQIKVLEDTTTKVPAEDAKEDCVFIRRFKVSYRYQAPQTTIGADSTTQTHDHIYYLVL